MNACNGIFGLVDKRFLTTRARVLFTAATTVLLGLGARAAQFEDVTTPSGIGQSSGMCYGTAWGDYNNDGFPDLYITAGVWGDTQNFLFRNAGNGTFVRVGAEAGPVATALNRSTGCAWGASSVPGSTPWAYWAEPRFGAEQSMRGSGEGIWRLSGLTL